MSTCFHSGCSSASTNSYKQVLKRQGRKLPYVPRKKKYNVFWPTFRGAVSWLRQHQKIIDTAIGLLEIYPNIISDYSLDVFWDFIYPYLYPKAASTNPNSRKTRKDITQTAVVLPKVKQNIPLITVTQDSYPEEESEIAIEDCPDYHKVPKVCVIGELHGNDGTDLTSSLIQELTSNSFVYRNSPLVASSDVVFEADSLIFLLSDQTISNHDCCEKLLTSWSLEIPTIFVRNKKFKLSSPLPETFLQQALKSENVHNISKNSGRSLTPSVGIGTLRQKRENFKRSDSATSAFHGSLLGTKHKSNQSSDLLFYLLNGYGEAIVYDENFPSSTTQTIKSLLHQKSDVSRNPSSLSNQSTEYGTNTRSASSERNRVTKANRFLNVPTSLPPLSIETDRVLPMSTSHSPEPLSRSSSSMKTIHLDVPDQHEIDQDPDSGVHSPIEKDTFYLVYPDPLLSPKNSSPKVVRWPPDEDDPWPFSPDSLTTLDSPITFCDIDLSKEINHDLYSTDESFILD